jgi:choline transport protein
MTIIQVIINVERPDYTFTDWQYTLACIAFIASTIFFNTWAARALPLLEAGAFWVHIIGFLVVIIPLWVLAPKNSAKDVFTQFVNESGYSSVGTAVS